MMHEILYVFGTGMFSFCVSEDTCEGQKVSMCFMEIQGHIQEMQTDGIMGSMQPAEFEEFCQYVSMALLCFVIMRNRKIHSISKSAKLF